MFTRQSKPDLGEVLWTNRWLWRAGGRYGRLCVAVLFLEGVCRMFGNTMMGLSSFSFES